MKPRTITTLAAALSIAAMPLPAAAQSENAAIVTQNFGCRGFIPTETGEVGEIISTAERAQSVRTKSGNSKLTCHFTVPDDLVPSSVRIAEGFLCRVQGELTDETSMSVTPGGKGKLTCQVKDAA